MHTREGTAVLDAQRSVLDRTDVILGAFDSEHTDLSLLGIMVRTGLPKTTFTRSPLPVKLPTATAFGLLGKGIGGLLPGLSH